MKKYFLAVFLLIIITPKIFSQTWDFGVGLTYLQGRMNNFNPALLEVGVSSDKGYSGSATYRATKEFEITDSMALESDSAKYNTDIEADNSTLKILSYDINLFYRFESYVHRIDVGYMLNINNYTYMGSEVKVGYAGPTIQYSTTIMGYDKDDMFYSVRIFTLGRSDFTSEGPYVGNKIMTLIEDNNPKSTLGFNIVYGFRK